MVGLAVRAGWLHRPLVAPPLWRGLPTRVAAPVGFPGLRTAGLQPGRGCVPGLDLGPGWGPGDREMMVLWAVPPARLVGRGAAGTPGPDVVGAWGFGPSVGFWAWGCTVSEGRVVVVSGGVAAPVCVGASSGGALAGPADGRSGVPWRGRGSGLACVAAARLGAGL